MVRSIARLQRTQTLRVGLQRRNHLIQLSVQQSVFQLPSQRPRLGRVFPQRRPRPAAPTSVASGVQMFRSMVIVHDPQGQRA